MNILFYFDFPFNVNAGGIERVTYLLAKELIKKNHKIIFLSSSQKNNQELEKTGSLQFHTVSNKKNLYREEIIKIIKKEKIDIIINQSFQNSVLKFLTVFNECNIPIISVYHNQPFPLKGKERIYLSLTHPVTIKGFISKYLKCLFPRIYIKERLKFDNIKIKNLINLSDKFILLSERYIKRISLFMPDINVKKLYAINNPNTFTKNYESKETYKKEDIVLFVGRIYDPQKNVTEFVRIWEKVWQNNKKWRALVVGDGPDKKYINKIIKDKKIQNITLIDNCKDIEKYYQKSKILCMTSVYEGLPMVLLEAMSFGCIPILYNSFEAAEDVVINNHNGKIVTPFETQEMIKAINTLIKDGQLQDKMAKNAIEDVKKYDVYTIASIWEEILMKVAISKNRG